MSLKLNTMRKILNLAKIFAVLALFSCCKKETTDNRDKYVGSWNYSIAILKHNFDSIGQHEEDSISYLGKINQGNAINELKIQYSKDSLIILNIDELGLLSGFPNQYCNGEFEGENRIHLFLRWGGLGGFISYDIDGTKK